MKDMIGLSWTVVNPPSFGNSATEGKRDRYPTRRTPALFPKGCPEGFKEWAGTPQEGGEVGWKRPCSPRTQQASMTSRPQSGDETPSPVELSAQDRGVEPANWKLPS
ncbi:MAG: hypothetical protein ACE5OZ_26300 [Candidatus Heimdallarchaeota archaeon]